MNYVVAIIGRPNVGKSTFFNVLAGDEVAIVLDTPGVTRDRNYTDVEWNRKRFTLIDTAGIEPKTNDSILKHMRKQAEIAIETADLVLFMVDAKQGLIDADFQIGTSLKKSKKKVVLVVNKVDNMKDTSDIYEFYNLGLGDPVAISSANRAGIGDLLDTIVEHIPEEAAVEEGTETKIAVIGKPNAGKSSLVNKLLGEDRMVVSELAGTTRDSIDTPITHHDKTYILIDTAGVRKRGKIELGIEKYSYIRTIKAIERSDVCVILIDGQEGITAQDTKVAGIVHEKYKGAILAVNKWDLVEKDNHTTKKYEDELKEAFKYMDYAKILFISALTGQRIHKIFDLVDEVCENRKRRITTGVLNDVLYEAMQLNAPPYQKGKQLRIYYMTQASDSPPTFVLFVNDRKLMHFSYLRYIENKIRERFDFSGTALKFVIKEKGESQ